MLEDDVTALETEAKPHLTAARAALFRWAEVVSSGDLEHLLALYAPDAILVPTLSDAIGGRADERRGYFETFLANPDLRCTITALKTRISRKLGTVLVGGLYAFTFMRDGREETVPARFLFTFEKIDDCWLITGHHSSHLSQRV